MEQSKDQGSAAVRGEAVAKALDGLTLYEPSEAEIGEMESGRGDWLKYSDVVALLARAADALDSQPTYTAPGVPEGFLLVPIIPTQEILDAIEDAAKAETSVEWDSNLGGNIYFGDASCVYNAILAVKPEVQIASSQPTDGGVRNG